MIIVSGENQDYKSYLLISHIDDNPRGQTDVDSQYTVSVIYLMCYLCVGTTSPAAAGVLFYITKLGGRPCV